MMNQALARSRLTGCYVTIPTLFHEDNLSLNLDAMRRHVRFVIDGGIVTGTGVLLAGGAAGDFSTLTFDERLLVAETVVEAAQGKIPVVIGAQSTSTMELVRLAKAAKQIGAEYIQVSPPFYFAHTEDDFYEYVMAAAEAADIGLIIYNTFWTSYGVSTKMVNKLMDVPNVIGLKWAMPDMGNMEFEQVFSTYASRFSIIDNQMRFVTSHMLGGHGIEVHVANYWPQWGVRIWNLLQNHQYIEAQKELVTVAMPFMSLWVEMEQYTSGDGYLDKLCMELVGLDSSRCRPPTRDIREQYRERARQMLIKAGVPNVLPA
jgi:dihydrodipicolinate synthase/N-acetylneuraminate lyase